MNTTINTTVKPLFVAHLNAITGPQGLGWQAAAEWLARQFTDGGSCRYLGGSAEERATWRAFNKARAAAELRAKTAQLLAARKAADEKRARAAEQAARAEKAEAVGVVPPHVRLGDDELARRRLAAADAKAAEKAAFAALIGRYRSKTGQRAT